MFCGVAHSPNSTTTGLPWRATKSMCASGLISRSKVLYQPESKGLPCSASVSTCVNDFSRCNHRANHDFPAPGKPHRTRRRAAPGVIWRPCFLAAALRAERLRAFSPRLRAFGPSSACFIAREIRLAGRAPTIVCRLSQAPPSCLGAVLRRCLPACPGPATPPGRASGGVWGWGGFRGGFPTRRAPEGGEKGGVLDGAHGKRPHTRRDSCHRGRGSSVVVA